MNASASTLPRAYASCTSGEERTEQKSQSQATNPSQPSDRLIDETGLTPSSSLSGFRRGRRGARDADC